MAGDASVAAESGAGQRSDAAIPLQSFEIDVSARVPMDIEDNEETINRTDEYLHPRSRFTSVRSALSPVRVGVSVVLAVASVCFASLAHEKAFTVRVKLDSVPDRGECEKFCARSLSTPAFAKAIGGRGICCSDSNGGGEGNCNKTQEQSQVQFVFCNRTSSNAAEGCSDTRRGQGPWTTLCQFKVMKPAWIPLTTVALFTFTIMLIIQGLPPEILMVGLAALYCCFGIISRGDLFEGFANKGVTSLAVLLPITEAVQETGVLEKLVGVLLGNPERMGGRHGAACALLRMILTVSTISATLSNTATVALMIPIIIAYARRLGAHPGKFAMPLSFAAQYGGVCTLIGTPLCIVAKGAMKDVYDIGMLSLTPCGVLIALTVTTLMVALSYTGLLKSSAAAEQDVEDADGDEEAGSTDAYHLRVNVQPHRPILGKTLESSGLKRMEGVLHIALRDKDADEELQEGDALEVWCTVAGVVALRRHPGLALDRDADMKLLGSKRRRRFFFEAAVKAGSDLCGSMNSVDGPSAAMTQKLRHEYGACYVAGPRRRMPVHQLDQSTSQAPQAMDIQDGSVLLFEADELLVCTGPTAKRWRSSFSLIQKVPGSSPPRKLHKTDKARDVVVVVGALCLIAAVSLELADIDWGGLLYLMVIMLIGGLTVSQLLEKVNARILLTIAGAMAIGKALENSGVMTFIAEKMMSVANSEMVLLCMVYFIAALCSAFINNSATVAILAPMVVEAVTRRQPGESEPQWWKQGRGLAFVLVYGAGACFMTPLGFQTNLMVMPVGEYTFMDFMRYGGLVQLVHMVCAVGFVKLYDLAVGSLCNNGVESACYPPYAM